MFTGRLVFSEPVGSVMFKLSQSVCYILMIEPKPKKILLFCVPQLIFILFFEKFGRNQTEIVIFKLSVHSNLNNSGQNHPIRYIFGLGCTLGLCLLTILFKFIFWISRAKKKKKKFKNVKTCSFNLFYTLIIFINFLFAKVKQILPLGTSPFRFP